MIFSSVGYFCFTVRAAKIAAPMALNADGIAGFRVKSKSLAIPTMPRAMIKAIRLEPMISFGRPARSEIRFHIFSAIMEISLS